MIHKDNTTPDGRLVESKRGTNLVSPCVTRTMTAEEWERYGPLNTDFIRKPRHERPEIVFMPKDSDREFAERLRAERERLGESICKFSARCNVSPNTLNRVERLWIIPKKSTKKRICNALGWEVEQ